MKFEEGTQVDLMRYGKWEGPFMVTSGVGRTAEHLVLRNPENGVLFEEHVDEHSLGYQIRPHQKEEWLVRKAARALVAGDKFIFSDDLGGEGEVVTVEGAANSFGTIEVAVEEFDFTILLGDKQMVTMSNG